MIWSTVQLSEALGAVVPNDIKANRVQFNSRDVQHGDLFIALKGNTDGHLYVEDALKNGAAAVIASREVNVPKEKLIKVEDTLTALHKLAEYKRQNSPAKFIGITGSNGKTGTKEALKVTLEAFGKVFAGRGNFNNHLGVPINLASMPDDLDYAIFEMGMNSPGEISHITKMVKPDIAIITAIHEAHLEFFNSVFGIVDAKCEIFQGLKPNGMAIINSDNKQYYRHMLDNLAKLDIKNIYSFGQNSEANSRLKSYEVRDGSMQLAYTVKVAEKVNELTLSLPTLPKQHTQNFAAILMTAYCLGLDINKAAGQLGKFELLEGRGKIIKARKNNSNYTIIGDYYNANPSSMKAALENLATFEHPKKVAVIGDMRELGPLSIQFHRDLIPYLVNSGIYKIFLVGALTRHIYDELSVNNIDKYHFTDVEMLISELDNLLAGEELILVKGSNIMRLKKILEYFDN